MISRKIQHCYILYYIQKRKEKCFFFRHVQYLILQLIYPAILYKKKIKVYITEILKFKK